MTDISCGGCVRSNLSKPCTVPKLPLRVSSCFCPVWYEIAIFSSHQKTMKGFYLQYFSNIISLLNKKGKTRLYYYFLICAQYIRSLAHDFAALEPSNVIELRY